MSSLKSRKLLAISKRIFLTKTTFTKSVLPLPVTEKQSSYFQKSHSKKLQLAQSYELIVNNKVFHNKNNKLEVK